MNRRVVLCTLIVVAGALSAQAETADDRKTPAERTLREGWALQTSAKVAVDGDVISISDCLPKDWYAARVPSTVLGVLVKDNLYPDPGFGMSTRQLPSTDYTIGTNSSDSPMDPTSPFTVPSPWRTL